VTETTVARRSVAANLKAILASPQISRLIAELQETRWTGRPGYPIRSMVGMALAKSLYALPTWTRTVALVGEHTALAEVIAPEGEVPSVYACYRFTEKLRRYEHLLEACAGEVVAALRRREPEMGRDLAIDASDLPAYANGQRYVSRNGPERERYSDPDATWGHRSAVSTRKGGGFYGYRLHAAVCSKTGLPVAWQVETARDHELRFSAPLIDTARRRGAAAATAALDKGYDNNRVYAELAERGCLPLIPLRATPDVKRGKDRPPTCSHGEWTFAGADRKRGATKWRCPTGECKPASVWVAADRLHPLIPRETKRWKAMYRRRASVERAFGRLKNEWGLKPLRVRGLAKVRLHVELTMLAQLSSALMGWEAAEVCA
jgi:Transposase DDE domain